VLVVDQSQLEAEVLVELLVGVEELKQAFLMHPQGVLQVQAEVALAAEDLAVE